MSRMDRYQPGPLPQDINELFEQGGKIVQNNTRGQIIISDRACHPYCDVLADYSRIDCDRGSIRTALHDLFREAPGMIQPVYHYCLMLSVASRLHFAMLLKEHMQFKRDEDIVQMDMTVLAKMQPYLNGFLRLLRLPPLPLELPSAIETLHESRLHVLLINAYTAWTQEQLATALFALSVDLDEKNREGGEGRE